MPQSCGSESVKESKGFILLESIALQRASTSNNIHQLIRNCRLSSTIVLHLQGSDHVLGRFCRVVHGVTTERGFMSGSAQTPIDTKELTEQTVHRRVLLPVLRRWRLRGRTQPGLL